MRCTELTLMAGYGHCRPMGCFPGRIGAGQGNNPIDDRLGQRRDARRPGLAAQQAVDASPHLALLPAPDHRLALADLPHDRRRPKAVGGQ
jgi:hypothetical protein